MSLRVWLPLDGTLDNQGLDNVIVTNNGAVIDDNGKIGKCYSFNGNNSYISLNGDILYSIIKGGSQPFSIAMWVYHADNSRAILFGDYGLDGKIDFNIELTTAHEVRFYWNNSPSKIASSTIVTQNVWSHLVIIYDGTKIIFYKDGLKTSDIYNNSLEIKTKTFGDYYLGRDSRTGNTVLNGKINDFRIYDHALSSMEVKQLAQGLILHYPLNNININENVEYDCSGYCHNGERIGTFEYINDTPKYDMATHINNVNQKIYIQGLTTVGFGNSYSFAWWGKRNSNSSMFWGFSNGIRLNGMYTGRLWNTSDASNNPLYEIDTTTQVTAPTVNIWHHYVMTGNGEKNYVYIDGELWAESKIYKSINGTAIYINGFDNQTHYSSNNMSISDFRIYATALSAEDVLALYKNSVYIDNEGNLYGAELREI